MKCFNRVIKILSYRGEGLLKPVPLLLFILVAALFILTKPVYAQVASPLQTGHFGPVVMNIRDMAHPPPGLFVLWYNVYASSNKYIDRDGKEFSNIRLDQIHPDLPNIDVSLDVNAFVSVPGVFWASPFKILGGARYMAGISQSYVYADVSILTERSGGIIDTTITRVSEDKVSGFSDLFIAPLGLSWGLDRFDVTLFYGFYAPTGKYETGGSDATGLGFWTHQVQGYGYYYPVADKSTAIMLGLTYELNGKIKDIDVSPGNRFSLEWGASQYLSEQFELGVHGGHNWQISDDTGNDVYWDAGYHDRRSTVAFSANYWPWTERLSINLKYAFDFDIRQRVKNNTWMFNLVFIPNILTGD